MLTKLLSDFVLFMLCKINFKVMSMVSEHYFISYTVLSVVLQMAGIGFMVSTLAIFYKNEVIFKIILQLTLVSCILLRAYTFCMIIIIYCSLLFHLKKLDCPSYPLISLMFCLHQFQERLPIKQ